MMVDVPVVGKVGDRLTSYFSDFGKFEGQISDIKAGGFLLEVEMTHSMREKFTSKLTWLEKKQKDPGIVDGRKDARINGDHSKTRRIQQFKRPPCWPSVIGRTTRRAHQQAWAC